MGKYNLINMDNNLLIIFNKTNLKMKNLFITYDRYYNVLYITKYKKNISLLSTNDKSGFLNYMIFAYLQ